jgi:anti-sigma regulatory factor (Ser/Thr protein kinase)
MNGLINLAIEEMATKKFSIETWQQIKRRANVEADVFVDTESYSDEITYRLVTATSEILRLTPADVIALFKEYWIMYISNMTHGPLLEVASSDLANLGAHFAAPRVHRVLEIPGNMEQLAAARHFVRHFCENEVAPPMAAEDTDLMELAVNECVSNVVRHAYKGGADESIQIVTDAYDDQIHLQIYDRGESFNPDDVPEPEFDGSADGGFGLYIIRACMDEMQYGQDDQGRNCFTMIKKFAH